MVILILAIISRMKSSDLAEESRRPTVACGDKYPRLEGKKK